LPVCTLHHVVCSLHVLVNVMELWEELSKYVIAISVPTNYNQPRFLKSEETIIAGGMITSSQSMASSRETKNEIAAKLFALNFYTKRQSQVHYSECPIRTIFR